MKHARPDYNRIQDPANLIPEDEPVFLLRGQDETAPQVVERWAFLAHKIGASNDIVDAAMGQAKEMRRWQLEHKHKVPDMPSVKPNNSSPVNNFEPNDPYKE